MDDDYEKYGGVAKRLDILNEPKRKPTPVKTDELFLERDYEVKLGKLTWTTGIGFVTGMTLGGAYGLALGVRQGGATPKLFLNSVLNTTSLYSPAVATQCAGISLIYSLLYQFNGWAFGLEGTPAATVNGMLAGGIYKSFAGWKPMGKYSAAAAIVFTCADRVQRGQFTF